MDRSGLMTQQLGDLTITLDDPGTDLKATLDVLSDDLTAAVPSYLGFTLTLQLDHGSERRTNPARRDQWAGQPHGDQPPMTQAASGAGSARNARCG